MEAYNICPFSFGFFTQHNIFKVHSHCSIYLNKSSALEKKIGNYDWCQTLTSVWGFPGGSYGKESACDVQDLGSIPGLLNSPGGGHDTHSSVLAWRIPWTEESGGLQSMGSQTVGHDWTTKHSTACGDYFEIYINIKSLCCTSETNTTLCVNYSSV